MMNTRFCQVRFYIKKTDAQTKSIKIVSKRRKSPKFGALQIYLQKQSTELDDCLCNPYQPTKKVPRTIGELLRNSHPPTKTIHWIG